MSHSHRDYDLVCLYVEDDEVHDGILMDDDDASGVYVRLHEVIAMLRHEALLSDSSDIDAVADILAEEAVDMLTEVEQGEI